MNPLAKIVKPDPQPAYVLLALIFGGFGGVLYSKTGWKGAAVFFVVAAVLATKFIRGAMIESQLMKSGLRAEGRVIRVEQDSQVWHITFAFNDSLGVAREQSFDENDEESVNRYQRPGAVVKFRYHPDNPDQFRILD